MFTKLKNKIKALFVKPKAVKKTTKKVVKKKAPVKGKKKNAK